MKFLPLTAIWCLPGELFSTASFLRYRKDNRLELLLFDLKESKEGTVGICLWLKFKNCPFSDDCCVLLDTLSADFAVLLKKLWLDSLLSYFLAEAWKPEDIFLAIDTFFSLTQEEYRQLDKDFLLLAAVVVLVAVAVL